MSSTFTNPILWEDLPDPEIIRVHKTYYMSASSFHFSPGAPILQSSDLVHWEYIGHSVPSLPPAERFSLDGKRPVAYGKGVWASTLEYRESNGLFYFYTPVQGTDKTFVYTARDPSGEWTAHEPIERFYYDLGVLVDEDDGMYIAHGTRVIEVARLDGEGLREVENQVVYRSGAYLEGARMYKINGAYYIWVTKDWDTQCVLKSTTGPFGPYEEREVIVGMRSPLAGSGSPHQGALVDTPDGKWYYMAFIDAYPVGRIPVLAPVEFDSDGWPRVTADYTDAKGEWRLEYPYPHVDCAKPRSCFRRYEFTGSTLEPCWEWNHNPDNSRWSIENDQLVLRTGTATESLHLATNTLTLRTVGPGSIATFCIDTSGMNDGDRAGVSMFRDESAYIGIHKEGDIWTLVYLDGAKVSPKNLPVGWLNGRPTALDWELVSNGSVKESTSLKSDKVWLRIKVDLRSATPHVKEYEEATRNATFEYSYDGVAFERLGPTYTLTKSTAGYVGYRFGLFNFATKALGGEIRVSHCDLEAWETDE
ncbi:glycosyl hydrolase [Aspergillus karnatakaensis]|uniref:glycosyl hydrolase n=1 Tax=Aspergillus karnatakaensis TaxID=1810916 RepID=UPI003CCCEC54